MPPKSPRREIREKNRLDNEMTVTTVTAVPIVFLQGRGTDKDSSRVLDSRFITPSDHNSSSR